MLKAFSSGFAEALDLGGGGAVLPKDAGFAFQLKDQDHVLEYTCGSVFLYPCEYTLAFAFALMLSFPTPGPAFAFHFAFFIAGTLFGLGVALVPHFGFCLTSCLFVHFDFVFFAPAAPFFVAAGAIATFIARAAGMVARFDLFTSII